MSLLSRVIPNGPNGFGYASTAEQATHGIDLAGQTLLVTGTGSGLGRETLRVLALRGALVIATARSQTSAEAACDGIVGTAPWPLACDLSDPRSVLACIDSVKNAGVELDAIVCNAGVMAPLRLTQAFGYEIQFFTNHVGHFLLVTRLLDRLSSDGRVVVVSSNAHRRCPAQGIEFDNLSGERRYSPLTSYGQSKLANLLFARELSRRLPRPGQRANALHPGVIATQLTRSLPRWARSGFELVSPLALKDVAQGAATQCYLAARTQIAQNGEYFSHCNPVKPSRWGQDAELSTRLWETTARIVNEL